MPSAAPLGPVLGVGVGPDWRVHEFEVLPVVHPGELLVSKLNWLVAGGGGRGDGEKGGDGGGDGGEGGGDGGGRQLVVDNSSILISCCT